MYSEISIKSWLCIPSAENILPTVASDYKVK